MIAKCIFRSLSSISLFLRSPVSFFHFHYVFTQVPNIFTHNVLKRIRPIVKFITLVKIPLNFLYQFLRGLLSKPDMIILSGYEVCFFDPVSSNSITE